MQKKSLSPRNGVTLVTGIVARISDCANQKDVSLEDQQDHGRAVSMEYFTGPTEFRLISTKGKGERLDRPELLEIEEMLQTRELDLLICEDIGRLVRGADAVRLCGIAVDNGTRVIVPHDCVDTWEATWEEDVLAACRDHVSYNAHTSRRLKMKLMNRFAKFGGAMARPIFGYVVPVGARTYDDWLIDPDAMAIIVEWFRRLRADPNCSAVADWLNASGVPVGRFCRSPIWTGAMVRRLSKNPLLKGLPERGRKHTIKHHQSGRRISVPNPQGATVRACPHLLIIPPEEFDEVNHLLDAAHRNRGRKFGSGVPDVGSRKQSRFPGQSACCAYCGRVYVWGANGMPGHLQCNGSRQWKCWNSVGFSGALSTRKIMECLRTELFEVEGFADQYRAMIASAGQSMSHGEDERRELERRLGEIAQEKSNLVAAIKHAPASATLLTALSELEAEEETINRRLRLIDAQKSSRIRLPDSVKELRAAFTGAFEGLALDSFEFARCLRPIIRTFHVSLVQLLDGGPLLPRAHVTLDFCGIVPGARSGSIERSFDIDLFTPPKREIIRPRVMAMNRPGTTTSAIAAECGVSPLRVQEAVLLATMMAEQGRASPYVVVTEPPSKAGRLSRHLHPRYRFEPLPGYPFPPTASS